MVRLVWAVLAALAALGVAPSARADDAASPLGKVPPWFIPEGEPMKSFAFELNPLGIAIGLFSANLEYVIAAHHALIVTPHYYYAVPGTADEITGGGVEGGYRYYSGLHGPEGVFLGASVGGGAYRYVHRVGIDTPQDPASDTSYVAYGAAVDAGYQILLNHHMVIGAGVGAMYRFFLGASPSWEPYAHARHELFYGSGVRPRVLFSFGGAL